MEKSHTIKLFLKFGLDEHINDLYENGTIYMNSIHYFQQLNDKNLRGDPYEGLAGLNNYPKGIIENKELNVKADCFNIHIPQYYDKVYGNIFCLYSVSSYGFPNPLEFKVSQENAGFGMSCLMVKNNPLFLKKIENELKRMGLAYSHGFVEYYDRYLYNGKLTVFQKPKEFEYQKEFRFYISRKSTEPLKIKIGSLKNIAVVHKAEDIINTLRITPKKTRKN